MRFTAAFSIFALIGLSACGDTFGEQALIGAGAGTVAAAAVGGHLAAGAVVGGAANVVYCKEFSQRC
ncbi:MAG: hypothetical protein GY767_16015 [Shimia sp.]|nr:hypothetical protein [Shimia sp.]MCP4823487.1 hypothetical protein [Shimia sp.]